MKITNVLVEYLVNPIGLGIKSPRITWNLDGIEHQDSYLIKYSINGKNKKTKKINSSSMNYVFEEEFNSRDYIEFSIIVYFNDQSIESYKCHFEIGLLNQNDFIGKWISGNYQVDKKLRYPVDGFKKIFNVQKIKKARLYITALGLYEASLNDQRVGKFVLAPGSTDYRKRVQYQTYDVTNLLKNGENELKILLADGWYRGSIGAKGFRNIFGKQTALRFQLEIIDKHNNLTTIFSDNSLDWSNDGPITFADFKDGENIDFNKEFSFNGKAIEVKKNVFLSASNNTFVEENEVFSPFRYFKSNTNKIVYEFNQNLAGYVSFVVKAKKNQKIKVVLGEMIDENKDVTLKNIQTITKGKKSPLQEINIICKEGTNEYHAKFMYAGFKYASFEMDDNVKIIGLKQIALYSQFNETSSFNCSNDLINIFYKNTLWSLKSNSCDVPTDCPTRERMGWTGDSQVFFNTASFLVNYAPFAKKHLVDVYDRQDKNGRLPQIAPYNAEDWFMNVMNGSVGWADVGVLIPYQFYKKYGDIRILEENYDKMVRYAKFMIKRCGPAKGLYSVYAKPLHLSKENRKYGVNTGQSYGEWAEPNDVKPYQWTDFALPHPEESMAYTSYILSLMIEISNILGRTENNELFKKYSEGVKRAYQELVTKPKFTLDTDRQCKLVRPLYMNLLTEEQKEFARKRLIKALNNYGFRLGTGFLSTPFILDVLASYDIESAYKLLENEEMPGWLFMAKNSTGTIWEGWEGPKAQHGISSLNHYSKGAMVEWLFSGMCGINIEKENEFNIKPIVGGSISYAQASYQSIYGVISSKREKEKDCVKFEIDVPYNTCANFEYGGHIRKLGPGKHTIRI